MLKKLYKCIKSKRMEKFLKKIKKYDVEKRNYIINLKIDELKEEINILENFKQLEE